MAVWIPDETRPFDTRAEDRSTAFVAHLILSEKVPGLPLAIGGGNPPIESPPIYVQGFNQVQMAVQLVGAGLLVLEYSICHPKTFLPIAYRRLLNGVAVAGPVFANFGISGSTVPAFNGDLFTFITLRASTSTGVLTLSEMVMWFGIR